jgi:hypothetical protein
LTVIAFGVISIMATPRKSERLTSERDRIGIWIWVGTIICSVCASPACSLAT